MRINRLILKNFRSHRESEFNFSRINIVRGPNGFGKTSLQLAIELALTGKNDRTDLAGRGAQSLTTVGEQVFMIELLTENGHITFHRNGTGNNIIVGTTHAGKQAYAWIEANIAPLPVLSAVLNSYRFLEMRPEEQRALLAGALAADPVPVDEEILKLHASLTAGFPMNRTVTSAADVDSLYNWHFKQRTEVNRAVKALGDLQPPTKPEGIPERDAVSDQLTQLRADLTTKTTERQKTLSEFTGRKSQLAAAQVQLKQYEGDVLSSDDIDRFSKLAKKRTLAAKLDKEIAETQASLTAQRNELIALQEPQNDKCSLCGQSLPLADRSQMIATLQERIPNWEATLVKLQAERTKLGDPEHAQERLNAHQKAQAPYIRAEQTIRDIGELGTQPDVSALDEEIADLKSRIPKGEDILAKIDQYNGRVMQHKEVGQRAEKLKAQSEALDKLVEYFSDKGPLKGKLIGGKLPAFRDRINEVLARFGFVCQFDLDPYRLAVGTLPELQSWELSLDQLSESEQYRFGIAFSVALAEATGVGMVVIDKADMLGADARSHLVQILEDSKLDQSFVLCTGDPLSEYPCIDGVRFFELEKVDGRTCVRSVVAEEVW